jgi:hypothetical protein
MEVLQSVAQSKWDKTKALIVELLSFARYGERRKVELQMTRSDKGLSGPYIHELHLGYALSERSPFDLGFSSLRSQLVLMENAPKGIGRLSS